MESSLTIATRLLAETEAALAAVSALHGKRTRTVDGYTLQWCVECRQDWPCPTVAALSPSTDDTEPTCPPHDFDLLRQCRRCGLGSVRSTDDTEAESDGK
jgi:hypothetical protein